MATVLINSADVFHFDSFPNPQLLRPHTEQPDKNCPSIYCKSEVGPLKFSSTLFHDMHIMNIHWKVGRDLTIVESSRSDTVNINFQMSGCMSTRFTGITSRLNMKPSQHNLIFSPEGGFQNTVRGGEQVEMFHISLDKTYFAAIIGCGDSWSERAQQDLLKERPFAGRSTNADVTPYMHKLIRDIKQSHQAGAMQNLLVQSSVLELLALQVGQMHDYPGNAANLTTDEIGRLRELKSFIEAHFLDDFSLTQLSRICLLNEFKLKKGFKELFGTTVFAYLRKLRMEFAKNLLLDTLKSVEDISEVIGYEHPHHFSTAFRRYCGVSPSDFRALGKSRRSIYHQI